MMQSSVILFVSAIYPTYPFTLRLFADRRLQGIPTCFPSAVRDDVIRTGTVLADLTLPHQEQWTVFYQFNPTDTLIARVGFQLDAPLPLTLMHLTPLYYG
jgi:hypothetical protein